MALDLQSSLQEYTHLKRAETQRNFTYYLLRQAVQGNFRWPQDWPRHIRRFTDNLCKPITERFATYHMGKGFSYNVDRPNSLEFREAAERTEKILRRLLRLSKSELLFYEGAKTGSQLGRTVFKVYKKGTPSTAAGPGTQHACFTTCQPDYFYGIPAGDDAIGEWSKVFYSYPMDIDEANRRWPGRTFKTEAHSNQDSHYEPTPEMRGDDVFARDRRVPVLEIWTPENYALIVGGVTIYNGVNTYTWSDTGKGMVPFIVIENIRNSGVGFGEADIGQARELNEEYNYLLSRKAYIVQRWLQPTLVWEGAPTNYSELLSATLGGGGALPARLGSKLSFLAYDKPNPAVLELEGTIREAILESAGMNEVALRGEVTGSVNTGPSLQAQFQPVLSAIDKKRKEWEYGIRTLFAMMLQLQESIGDSMVLGQAVINETTKSQKWSDGELVDLSGTDIMGLREVVIAWPGVLPKDDIEAAHLEMEKASQGFQSIYTTLEKLGEEYPEDELARIRMENSDPSLRGEKVAEQVRSQTPLIKAQMDQQMKMMEMQQGAIPAQGEEAAPPPIPPTGLSSRIRELESGQLSRLNTDGEEPMFEVPDLASAGAAPGAY